MAWVRIPEVACLWLGWDEPVELDGSRYLDRFPRRSRLCVWMTKDQIDAALSEVIEVSNNLTDGTYKGDKERRRSYLPSLDRLMFGLLKARREE